MEKTTETPTRTTGTYKARVLKYWDSALKEEFTMEAQTKEELFENFYNANRTYRYCNGCYFRFADVAVKDEYRKWYKSLSEMKRFDMYYGNGTVD